MSLTSVYGVDKWNVLIHHLTYQIWWTQPHHHPDCIHVLPSAPLAELSDDSSVESIEESLRTTDAEHAGTIPASPQATAMAMAGARAQANPTVERGPPHRRNVRLANLPLPVATVAPSTTTTSTTASSPPTLRPGETIWHSVTDGRRRRRARFFRPRNPQGQQSGKTNLFIVRKR